LHIVQTLRSAQPQPFVRRRLGERNRVFGPTGPSEYAAVRSQALLILAIPDRAPGADQLGLAIRPMSRSAAASAPVSASSPSASSTTASATTAGAGSACTHASRRRRQRQAENQDSARERVSESASLLATKLKKGVHGNGPPYSGESPKKHISDEIYSAAASPGGLLLKAPRARRRFSYRLRTGCASRRCQPARSSSGMRCSSRGKPTQR
jgi:hypothetical protein